MTAAFDASTWAEATVTHADGTTDAETITESVETQED